MMLLVSYSTAPLTTTTSLFDTFCALSTGNHHSLPELLRTISFDRADAIKSISLTYDWQSQNSKRLQSISRLHPAQLAQQTSTQTLPTGFWRWHQLIAPDVEILLTHGPRLEHLDDEQVFGQRVGEGTPASGIYILAVENKALSYNRGQTCYEDIALRQTPWVNLSVMVWKVLF